ncbi:MAG TPA: DegT/DnrJ/EryC1/StrS family aminotransferase [Candidatus Acidoferrales bacterium]|nr:DegT/DnrJ/EryC1/StrS family aminotransferase [Candidatus Acidoferrales bacterium]
MSIPLSKPSIGEREIEYVTRVLRTGRLSLGPVLEEFEAAFAAYAGARFAVATNSGTSALHLCVRALGIGPADEVLTTSFSFAASANCLLYERALPTFVDIDPGSLNLDPTRIREAIESDYAWDRGLCRPVNRLSGRVLKAILPVHVFGLPCAMGPIAEIAREFNLGVIEDACEALGAEYRGRHVGSFGDAAAFAFYANKQITTAEGGMIVTDNPQIARLCRSLRNQGRDEDAGWLRHARLGYNYRLSDLHAALGLAQLERVDELLAARDCVAAHYSRALAGVPQIELPAGAPGMKRSWFVYAIRLRGPSAPVLRNLLLAELRERGIACQAYFPAIHRQPYFKKIPQAPRRPLPHTESASERCLALPFFPSMTGKQVNEACAAVREILAQADTAIEAGEAQHQEAMPPAV